MKQINRNVAKMAGRFCIVLKINKGGRDFKFSGILD